MHRRFGCATAEGRSAAPLVCLSDSRLGIELGYFLCGGWDVIPLKFQRKSGVLGHDFKVATHRVHPAPETIAAWPVLIHTDGSWVRYAVPAATFPLEVEALSILSNLDGESERAGRYINVHSAYEAVVNPRDVTLSAIRHALAHPVTGLSRPDVLTALAAHFGGLRINLARYDHQKVIYHSIGAMLIAIDDAIYKAFQNRMHELIHDAGT